MLKHLKIIAIIIGLIIPAISYGGLFTDDMVSMVKDGTLRYDKHVKVGDAFDYYSYIKNPEWKSFQDAQKRKIVEFSAIVNTDKILDEFILKHNDLTKNYELLDQFKNIPAKKYLFNSLSKQIWMDSTFCTEK